MVSEKRARGNFAESLARGWLESKGYITLETNFNLKIGEIDLVMQAPNDGPVVFVEVRYRASLSHGGALESVDVRKQRKLRKTALAWLQKNASSRATARIDVIAIQLARPDTPKNQCWEDHQMDWIVNAIED